MKETVLHSDLGDTGEPAYVIRDLRADETGLLEDFLYEAIFVPEGETPPPRSIIAKPELRVYTENFGTQRGDHCLVAVFDGVVGGAVWTRIMHDYGHIDDETPSFAIALYREYRGRGVGTRLMRSMLARLRNEGYARASLSVQKANYALSMYQKIGFRVFEEKPEEYIMVYEL